MGIGDGKDVVGLEVDGDVDGFTDGLTDGKLDGMNDGSIVGSFEGTIVGCCALLLKAMIIKIVNNKIIFKLVG